MIAMAPGTPTWVDLNTSDTAAANRFYTALFGWTARVSAQPHAGGYTTFDLGGKAVAGASPLLDSEQPVAWSTYLATDDADATAARIEEAGGKVVVSVFDVLDQGRMGVFLDPAGAAFSVWQPMAMSGAELFNVPGALSWTELTTRDPEGAKAFYGAVFGWVPRDTELGSNAYTEWLLDGRSIGGMMPMVGDGWPADMTPHWMVYFAVADCDASADRAARLGGVVSVPPTDLPMGRFAVLIDPQGGVFSIIELFQD